MSPRPPRRKAGLGARARSLSDILYPTLDLHGKTEAEAERSVRYWLEEIRAAGEPVGRIITGRGKHSVGLPVLPGSVEALLEILKGSLVASYEREPGGGAYTVRLKRSADATPTARRAGISASRDIIRRAEETLAELGVDPTPALVEAEVRRILAESARKKG